MSCQRGSAVRISVTETIDFPGEPALTGTVNTPLWFSAPRPTDLMSAAAALNPDASFVWPAVPSSTVAHPTDLDPNRALSEEFRR